MFFITTTLATAALTRFRHFKRLWIMGAVSMVFAYTIDSTFIGLGAYSYICPTPFLSGIPLDFLLSSFMFGILFAHYYPTTKTLQLPYILLAAAISLLIEIASKQLGYITYIHWNLVKTYILDTFGFMAMSWVGICLNAIGKGTYGA